MWSYKSDQTSDNPPRTSCTAGGYNQSERDPNWNHEAERDRDGQGKHDSQREPRRSKPVFGVPKKQRR
ncbi:hypothetical protein PG990_010753 [Apiospora arundinis]|uniref:Uncharacterized protein n=1 Tax=Apiospora arundinis TaxID=335852 RepID=A0ABR2JH63_9PEZI